MTEPLPLEHLLSVEEVAQVLGVHPKTVRRLPIPALALGTGRRKFWRYRKADVERWIEDRIVA